MDKIDDEWSSVGITTTLRVLFDSENSKPECNRLGKVRTACCGFGWRFAIDTADQGNTIRIFFEPHLIRHSGLGPLNISVKRKSTEMKGMEYLDQSQQGKILLTTDTSILTTYESSATMIYPILSITISFSASLSIQIPRPNGLLRAAGALRQSLTGAEFLDTKFWCFSRRSSQTRQVGDPRAVFANSAILKSNSSYMDSLLSDNGFSESKTGMLDDEFPTSSSQNVDVGEYDYESDSDLEEVEEFSQPVSFEEPDFCAPTSEIGWGSISQTKSDQTSSEAKSADSQTLDPNRTEFHPKARVGQTIVIKDAAFTTWQALIFYLYTQDIVFLPLRSKCLPNVTSHDVFVKTRRASSPPPCSPKSMYRLADKIGLDELKALALSAIRSQISQNNIVNEMFCQFTSMYPDIEKMEIAFLCDNIGSAQVMQDFQYMAGRVVKGELPHASRILVAIFEILQKELVGRREQQEQREQQKQREQQEQQEQPADEIVDIPPTPSAGRSSATQSQRPRRNW